MTDIIFHAKKEGFLVAISLHPADNCRSKSMLKEITWGLRSIRKVDSTSLGISTNSSCAPSFLPQQENIGLLVGIIRVEILSGNFLHRKGATAKLPEAPISIYTPHLVTQQNDSSGTQKSFHRRDKLPNRVLDIDDVSRDNVVERRTDRTNLRGVVPVEESVSGWSP